MTPPLEHHASCPMHHTLTPLASTSTTLHIHISSLIHFLSLPPLHSPPLPHTHSLNTPNALVPQPHSILVLAPLSIASLISRHPEHSQNTILHHTHLLHLHPHPNTHFFRSHPRPALSTPHLSTKPSSFTTSHTSRLPTSL